MNILFNDVLQDSDAPEQLISSSLADRYEYTSVIKVTFNNKYKINAIGIGNTDASNIIINSNWMTATMPSSASWRGVTYGNGKFVTVAYNSNKAAYSLDGINWTAATLPSSANWSIVTYGNDRFVAIVGRALSSSNKAAYSLDGINWTAATMPSSTNWTSITYGNGRFVATSSNTTAAYSLDGTTWTETTMPSNAQWYGVAYGNGKFVAVSYYDGKAAYSFNGINWIETTMPSDANWYNVAYGNGKFVAVSYNNDKAAYSTDGINWTAVTLPSSVYWYGVTYGNGRFVAVSYNNDKAAYSIDGITWTETILPYNAQWYGVAYGNDRFVTVASTTNIAAYMWNVSLVVSNNGLYTIPEIETDIIFIQCNGSYIGRFAAGKAVNLKTSIPKEPTLVSTNKPRVTLSGQIINGLGGYNYWRVSLDTRYKIDNEKLNEIIKGFPSLSKGLPLFVSFEEEKNRLPFERLYVNDTNQQELSFESSINKNLFSRRFIFEERF